MAWTTPADITTRLRRQWDQGRILAAALSDEGQDGGQRVFPLRVPVSRPDGRAMAERFDEVRAWIRALEDGSKARRGAGYEIEWLEVNHRQLGRNRVPRSVVVPTEVDALALLGLEQEAARFRALAQATLRAFPELRPMLIRRPLRVLEHEARWERLLAVVAWLRERPRPGHYLRQMDVPGVDTKFVESHRGILAELLDAVLPEAAVDRGAEGLGAFEQRYGFLSKPALVRLRILDESLAVAGLTDLAAPAAQLARLRLPVRRVFVTENEINGLAFPPVAGALVIFGLGYGLERLREVEWLGRAELHYWGDVDTHGFAMLARLRAMFPEARSLMMDERTLLAHRPVWVEEPVPHVGVPRGLTPEELAVYEGLAGGRFGERVRLEQERVSFGWARREIERASEGRESPP